MKKLLLILGAICSINAFAESNTTYSSFNINEYTSSCYKGECIIDINISSDEMHKITGEPKILTDNLTVLSDQCSEYNCELMLKVPATNKEVELLMPDSEGGQLLSYKYQIPAYYTEANNSNKVG